jgi:hypothetical protein
VENPIMGNTFYIITLSTTYSCFAVKFMLKEISPRDAFVPVIVKEPCS